MNNRLVQKSKRLLSGIVATAIATSMLPTLPAVAETGEKYPYTLFAGSSTEGAITVNSGNFCINGNVATNGTIVSSGNMNVNGTKTENAGFDMIYIFDKIDTKYFSGNNVEEHTEDYFLDELNININTPTEVLGEAELTGNININTALKAFEDVTLNGEVKNTNDSVIYSKYGDIVIDSTNVNLNGLVYAPFGSVEVKAMNLNLNNVVIIADSIVLDCPNVNANYSTNAADFVGTVSEPLNIPKDEWQYMKDENENGRRISLRILITGRSLPILMVMVCLTALRNISAAILTIQTRTVMGLTIIMKYSAHIPTRQRLIPMKMA